MRNIFDNTHFIEIADKLYDILKSIPSEEISVSNKLNSTILVPNEKLVLDYITNKIPDIKFNKIKTTMYYFSGLCINTYEIITSNFENQICGYLKISSMLDGKFIIIRIMDYCETNYREPIKIKGYIKEN